MKSFEILIPALLLATLGCGGEGEPADKGRHEALVGELKRQRGHLEEQGRWRELPEAVVLSESQARQIERLQAIGYTAETEEVGGFAGVARFERNLAHDGLNLISSGHDSEALLVDMDGNVVHRWRYDFFEAFPSLAFRDTTPGIEYWRRVALLGDGSLLAIHEGLGILKVDRDSNLVWAVQNGAHHDLDVLDNGNIWVLTREARLIPRLNPDDPILEDSLTLLDPDGRELRRISLIECLENANLPVPGVGDQPPTGDVMHTNSLEVLREVPEGLPAAFRPGLILTSFRYYDMIALVDPRRERAVWVAQGDFVRQHDPQLLPDGTLQLFDNLSIEGRSAVTRYDPATMNVRWRFRGSEEEPFYSKTCGVAQALPNGNVLVTESDGGRALELTPHKRVVWEYWNPKRAGEGNRYIATLFEVLRLERAELGWLEGER